MPPLAEYSDPLTFLTGTDNAFAMNFSDASGPKASMSGKFYLTFKKNIKDADPGVFQASATFTTDTSGNATITITTSATAIPVGYFWYDVTLIVGGKVTRSLPGKAKVEQSVTQAVS